jgi:hypothetical protein
VPRPAKWDNSFETYRLCVGGRVTAELTTANGRGLVVVCGLLIAVAERLIAVAQRLIGIGDRLASLAQALGGQAAPVLVRRRRSPLERIALSHPGQPAIVTLRTHASLSPCGRAPGVLSLTFEAGFSRCHFITRSQ